MFSTRYRLFFWHLAAPILCSQPHPASFLQNRGRGIGKLPKHAAAKRDEKIIKAAYAAGGGIHHAGG
jgi:hypothetical protein